jgi:hypothetical protein
VRRAASSGVVYGTLDQPDSPALRKVRLRLRLPAGNRMTSVRVNGQPYRSFDPVTGTITLPRRTGDLMLEALYARRR